MNVLQRAVAVIFRIPEPKVVIRYKHHRKRRISPYNLRKMSLKMKARWQEAKKNGKNHL